MKKIILIVCLFCCIHAYTQTYEIKKGISETYRIEYSENDFTVVYNINNPLNLSDYNPLWHEKVKTLSYKTDPKDYVIRYILPEIQDVSLNDDIYIFLMRLYISLEGKLQFVEYAFPFNLDISIETIEKMEQAMKSENSFVLKFDPDNVKDIPYIMVVRPYSLGALRKQMKPSKPFKPLKPGFETELVD